jgi:two-component system NtrC family response regulator
MENRINRAVILSANNTISTAELELEKQTDVPLPLNLKEVREAAETIAIKRALNYADNNVSVAAKLLGVTRPTLYGLFEKYGIQNLPRIQADE